MSSRSSRPLTAPLLSLVPSGIRPRATYPVGECSKCHAEPVALRGRPIRIVNPQYDASGKRIGGEEYTDPGPLVCCRCGEYWLKHGCWPMER